MAGAGIERPVYPEIFCCFPARVSCLPSNPRPQSPTDFLTQTTAMALIPATILTGFLGAGKTTLLNRVLREPHGLRIAVIENEFGQENIDNEILVQDSTEQIVEMNNGCICCAAT
jgi:hypothetical protein